MSLPFLEVKVLEDVGVAQVYFNSPLLAAILCKIMLRFFIILLHGPTSKSHGRHVPPPPHPKTPPPPQTLSLVKKLPDSVRVLLQVLLTVVFRGPLFSRSPLTFGYRAWNSFPRHVCPLDALLTTHHHLSSNCCEWIQADHPGTPRLFFASRTT